MMRTSDFDFELPAELIARSPPPRRDASRMLVLDPRREDRGAQAADKQITDFPDFILPGDAVVFNNSKVIPCRFEAGGRELTLHTKTGDAWWAFAKKFGRMKIGEMLDAGGEKIEIIGKDDESGVLLKFHCADVFALLDKIGKMPLPPYVKRDELPRDRDRYQTVYADPAGSMAAPTAGLHFTPELLARIGAAGAKIVHITLHVGAGTWMPVKTEDPREHKMHGEYGIITRDQADVINGAKRVIAVGTTSLRLLESAAAAGGGPRIKPFDGTTDIFITPGHRFRAADALLTNFHLPKSTLFMLACAFAGTDEMKAAYAHAVRERYRFFSYGDCCLLFRKN